MTKRRSIRLQPLALCIAAIGLARSASAETVTYAIDIPDPPTAPAPLSFSGTASVQSCQGRPAISLPQFDPSPGTLNSAAFRIAARHYCDDTFSSPISQSFDSNISTGVAFAIGDAANGSLRSVSVCSAPVGCFFYARDRDRGDRQSGLVGRRVRRRGRRDGQLHRQRRRVRLQPRCG